MNNCSRITPLEKWISVKTGIFPDRPGVSALNSYRYMRLQETLNHVYEKSSFYREHLEGYPWRDISSIDDIHLLPFTTEADIKKNAPRMLCVSQDEINRVVTLDSSGTTGDSKRLYFTAEDQELTVDFFRHGMSVLTEPGDRALILLPCERPGGVGDLLARAIERIDAVPVRHGVVTSIRNALNEIIEKDINVIVGIPVQLLALAKFHEAVEGTYSGIKKILLSTDNVPKAISENLEKIFGCEVFNHYGMTEMGLGGGIDCCSHGGYHLREADLYFEIIDPETGKPLPEGEPGEVVFTTLTRTGMPLIRYRTGDISRFIPGRCECGSVLRRMDYIAGRKSGIIMMDESRPLTITELDECIFPLPGVIEYKATYIDSPTKELHINIISAINEISEAHVREAIEKNNSISQMIIDSRLKLKISLQEHGFDYIPATGKRTICCAK